MSHWTQLTGTKLTTLQESITTIVNLPLNSGYTIITKLISGSLPAGMRLKNNQIVGTPTAVPRATTSTFVLRATNAALQVQDRTFTVEVQGADEPEWLTPAGKLVSRCRKQTLLCTRQRNY